MKLQQSINSPYPSLETQIKVISLVNDGLEKKKSEFQNLNTKDMHQKLKNMTNLFDAVDGATGSLFCPKDHD